MGADAIKLLAISGSLRRDSFNRGLLRAAQELAPAGVHVVAYDEWAHAEAFDEDLEQAPPPGAAAVRARIEAADGLLIATPEYNGSMPGALKNALDWASRPHGLSPLAGKPVAAISSSPSPFGGTWAGESLRRALSLSGAQVTETELAIGKVDQLFADGELTDTETRAQVAALVEELTESVAAGAASGLAA
jgi:chromate reductase